MRTTMVERLHTVFPTSSSESHHSQQCIQAQTCATQHQLPHAISQSAIVVSSHQCSIPLFLDSAYAIQSYDERVTHDNSPSFAMHPFDGRMQQRWVSQLTHG